MLHAKHYADLGGSYRVFKKLTETEIPKNKGVDTLIVSEAPDLEDVERLCRAYLDADTGRQRLIICSTEQRRPKAAKDERVLRVRVDPFKMA